MGLAVAGVDTSSELARRTGLDTHRELQSPNQRTRRRLVTRKEKTLTRVINHRARVWPLRIARLRSTVARIPHFELCGAIQEAPWREPASKSTANRSKSPKVRGKRKKNGRNLGKREKTHTRMTFLRSATPGSICRGMATLSDEIGPVNRPPHFVPRQTYWTHVPREGIKCQ